MYICPFCNNLVEIIQETDNLTMCTNCHMEAHDGEFVKVVSIEQEYEQYCNHIAEICTNFLVTEQEAKKLAPINFSEF